MESRTLIHSTPPPPDKDIGLSNSSALFKLNICEAKDF